MRHSFRPCQPIQPPARKTRSSFRPALEALEERTLLSISFPAIGNQAIPSGKTLILPLAATASDGSAISYTVTSSDPDITSQAHTGNPFLKISVANFGDMTFALFQDLTPQTVNTIEGLIKSGFYDGLTFHRVVPGFVIQGGDPAGNGTGGPGFAFDDEFNARAIFSGNGQLAMANAGKDTNGSQFFVSIGPQRALDFNHTIFGQLVRGFDVLSAIEHVPNDANNRPLTPVVITSARLVPDDQDAVVTLAAAAGFTGAATITVTASDGHDPAAAQTFRLQATADRLNDPPILWPVSDLVTPANTPVTFTLNATDLENEQLTFEALENDNGASNAIITVTPVGNNSATVTVTPVAGFTGPIHLKVGVKDLGATNRNEPGTDPFDTQHITIGVGDQQLTSDQVSFNAVEGAAVTNVVVGRFTDADPNAVATDFTATVNWGEGDTNVPPAPLTQGTIQKQSDGTFTVTASKPSGYREAGIFTITVTIVDKLGATAHFGKRGATTFVYSTASVADAALSAWGVPVRGVQGAILENVQVAILNDANPRAKPADFSVTIDWGDGQTTPGTVGQETSAQFHVNGSHRYSASGSFVIRVTLTDATPAGDVPGSTATVASNADIVPVEPVLPTNQRFVARLYQDFLGRDPDQAGLAFYSGVLDQGLANRFQVALAIEGSQEYHTRTVEVLYGEFFHRAADPSGLGVWVHFLSAGGTSDGLRAILLGSDEYFQLHGGTNTNVVTALFQDILGRPPDDLGGQAWINALNNGLSRTAAAEGIRETPEGAHEEVLSLYLQYLHRVPDQAGLAGFSSALLNGTPREQLAAFIAASDEYFSRP